ncbi:hypothetical protein FDP41_008790 [Naegleria fowleri]|uniref:Uncharacterized protein n=1 Tax=Naegleria fowleri TaxID=5763 RepID=A0A6A5BG39_NAEFO|nr:uncharacterized protein FDP41_008790 [Naegleria fowleri]KAF0972938.1 hypothetical protein FDP41_008790 [Naegleria fowleri]CAG4712702.1 unnamed protein product [Naegleria fowleri]
MPTKSAEKKSIPNKLIAAGRHHEESDDDEAPEMIHSKAKMAVAALAEQELKKQSVRDKKLKKLSKKSEKRKHSEEQEVHDEENDIASSSSSSSAKKQKKLLDASVLDFLVQQDEKQEASTESSTTKTPQIQATLETAAPKKSRSKRFVDLKLEATLAKEKVDPFTVKTEVDPAVLKFLHLEFYKKNHRKDTAKFVDAKRSTIVPASDFFGKQRWLTEQVFLNPYDLQH